MRATPACTSRAVSARGVARAVHERGERDGPAQVEVAVVLPGEADAAVQLDGHLGRAHARGHGAGRRDGRRQLGRGRARRGALGVPRGRGGQLGVEQQVGAVVLDGLERADRAAELLPLLDVGDGHVQARVRRCPRPRRRPGCGRAAARRPPRPGSGCPTPATTVAARRVGSSTRRSTVAVNCSLTSTSSPTTSSTTSASPPPGTRSSTTRPSTSTPARPTAPILRPVGERGQQLRPPRLHEDRGRQHAGQERPRRHHAAQLLQHHGELRQPRALAAVLLGHVQPEPAEPGDLLPRGGHRLVGGVEQRPRRGALPGEEEGAGHLGQRAVVVGDRQGHGATTSRSRRGPASRRTRGRPRGRRPRS